MHALDGLRGDAGFSLKCVNLKKKEEEVENSFIIRRERSLTWNSAVCLALIHLSPYYVWILSLLFSQDFDRRLFHKLLVWRGEFLDDP